MDEVRRGRDITSGQGWRDASGSPEDAPTMIMSNRHSHGEAPVSGDDRLQKQQQQVNLEVKVNNGPEDVQQRHDLCLLQRRPSGIKLSPPPSSPRKRATTEVLSVDFDAILLRIGAMGRYQLALYLLMCIPATLPAAFLSFGQVFLSAEPDHWCKVAALMEYREQYGNLSIRHIKRLSIPTRENLPDVYEKCYVYDVNYTDLYVNNGWAWPDSPDPTWKVSPCREGWVYDRREYKNTLVTELDLVCENGWWVSTSTALFYVGSLFGNVLFGLIADKYGRRTSFFLLLFTEVTLAIVTCFSPNYVVFTVLRTLNGFTFPAIFQIPFILCLEIMGPAYRTFAGMMICLFFAVALMILAGLAYVFNTWFSLALVTSVPFVSLFSYWFFVPESPRWLLSYSRLEEAEKIVQSIAKWNGKEIPPDFVHQFVEAPLEKVNRRRRLRRGEQQNEKLKKALEEQKQSETRGAASASPSVAAANKARVTSGSRPNMLQLFLHYPVARRNFTLITFNWLANALVYNGLSFYSANLNVSSHLGFFISSAVEVPSYLIGWYFMDRWGRRWILFATMMVGGISCICCVFVPTTASPWITVTLAMIGKFKIAASFAVIYVYAGELMPTVVRSEAMGISSFVAGIGLLIFPYINALGAYSQVLPLVIMGTLSVMGGVTAMFLPETLHKHLPNTLEESENFGSSFKIFSCPVKSRRASECESAVGARGPGELDDQLRRRPSDVERELDGQDDDVEEPAGGPDHDAIVEQCPRKP